MTDETIKELKDLRERISWALRCNSAGVPGYVSSILKGDLSVLYSKFTKHLTVRDYIEAVEKDDRENDED